MDPLVHITSVKDAVGFDPVTLNPLRNKVVTFVVGTHGPFNLAYKPSDYSQQRVEQDIQNEVDTLRSLGALTAAS